MTIELVPLGTLRVNLAEPIVVGQTPKGTRVIVELTDARFEGERLRARLKGAAAADWALIGPDGTCALDIRYTLETDDGAVIFLSYSGRLDLSGGPGTAPVYSTPQFETGDERYAWLNKVQAVAKGVFDPENVLTLEVYELT